MSLLLLEGFDDGILESSIAGKWTSFQNNNGISTTYGRNGKGKWFANQTDHNTLTLGSDAHATAILGVACRFTSLVTQTNEGYFPLRFHGDSGAITHVAIGILDTGEIQVKRGDSTTLATSSGLGLTTNVWYYIEAKVTVNDTTGAVVVKVNGTEVVNISGVDTRNGGTDGIVSQVRIGMTGSGSQASPFHGDDIYICNGAGTTHNDFLGDGKVETLLPNGNGTYSQLVGSDADSVDNYLLVDEAIPSSADYVGSATDGSKDTYAYANLSDNTRVVKGVQATMYAAKSDTGAKSARQVLRTGAIDYIGSDESLSTTYTASVKVWEQNPNTATAWTGSEVDAAEFGFEVRP